MPEETPASEQFDLTMGMEFGVSVEEIEAWGTSHVDRGDDPWLLVEMAATRARKRALSIVTGAGAVAVEELRNDMEEP